MAKKIPKNQREVDSLKVQLARALADYDNLIKRTEKEKSDFVLYANQNLIEELIPVIEMLILVQNHNPDPGLALSISGLKNILEKNGVIEVNPGQGSEFDPEKHEVVESIEDSTQGEGAIVQTLSSGFVWSDGKLIKPAKVKVNSVKKGEVQNI